MAQSTRHDVLPPMEGVVYRKTLESTSETYRAPLHWTAGAFVTFVNTSPDEVVTLLFGDNPDVSIVIAAGGLDSVYTGLSLTPRASTGLAIPPGGRFVFRAPYSVNVRRRWYFAVGGNVGAQWTAFRSSHPVPETVVAPDDLPTILWWRTDTGVAGNPNVVSWQDKQEALIATAPATNPLLIQESRLEHDGIEFAGDGDESLDAVLADPAFNSRDLTMVVIAKRTDNNNSEQGLLTLFAPGNSSEVTIGRDDRKVFVRRSDSSGASVTRVDSTQDMVEDSLAVYALVVDADLFRLYVNGVQVASSPVGTDPAGIDAISIGNLRTGADSFGGEIFEAYIIGAALNELALRGLSTLAGDYYSI